MTPGRAVLSVTDLPTVNATLNATSAALLVAGLVLIRRRHIQAHRAVMITAVGVSLLFLVSYLTYHAQVGSRRFTGEGWIRPVYFAILISHTLLAAAVVPMAIVTLRRGLRRDDARHRRLARWTWPVWMYVSVTGVVIYVLLYHIYAA